MTLQWNRDRWDPNSLLSKRQFLEAVGDKVVDNWKESFDTSPPGRIYRRRGREHVASIEGYPPNVDTGS